jgi:hypothetical protein
MKKLFLTSLAMTLALASFAPFVKASSPYSDAHQNSARVQGATHHFEYLVQKNSLSELLLQIPEQLKISRGIDIQDQTGKTLNAKVSINGKQAVIAFAQPVPPDTTISVKMRGILTPGYARTWQYKLYGKFVGIEPEIPLGLARIQTYGN